MGDAVRRGRGEKVGNGVVKREIVRFLFDAEDGAATEGAIREHLYERFGVQDRATIRNQHLGYLKTTGRIGVEREPGRENVWFLVDDPSLAAFVFDQFAGDELAEVYRTPFFRDHAVGWYSARRTQYEMSPALEECTRDFFSLQTWEESYLMAYFLELRREAVGLSPSHFTGATSRTPEGTVVATLLLVEGLPHEEGGAMSTPAVGLGLLIADLLVDFERYAPLRREIVEFMRDPGLHRLMASLFPPGTIDLVYRCLSGLMVGKPEFSEEELVFDLLTEPLAIPPPRAGTGGTGGAGGPQ